MWSSLNLVVRRDRATIAEQNRASELFLQLDLHLGLDPTDNIEISDVEDVVTVKLLLLVDGLRSGLPTDQLEDLFLLQLALLVTTSPRIVTGDVSEGGTNLGERGVLGITNDGLNLRLLLLNELRRVLTSLASGNSSSMFEMP